MTAMLNIRIVAELTGLEVLLSSTELEYCERPGVLELTPGVLEH